MCETKEQTPVPSVQSDGGTGEHTHPDFVSAYKSVTPADKRRAFIMLGAAGVTVAFLLLSRLLWLLEPVYDLIYYGNLTRGVYYVILGLVCTAFVVSLNVFIKHKCDVRLFRVRERTADLTRALIIIAIAAIAVLIVNATFGFTFKLQKEMGMGVTLATAILNISVHVYYGFHLWLGFVGAALVQYALSILFPAKHTVPWGAIFLVTVYGLLELIFEFATTSHLYPLHYYFLTYVYAAIYMLTGRSFHVSFWASVVIMVL